MLNQTDTDFITSDNPVALSNWWFTKIYRQRPGAGIGLAQAGLEIYLPLSPKHQLILYDRNIWSVPRADVHGTIRLHNPGDVFALNERQLLNALHNVYFGSMESEQHIRLLAKECADRRKQDKVLVNEWVVSKDHPHKYVRAGSPEAEPRVRNKIISTEPTEVEVTRRVTLFSRRYRPRFDEHPSAVGAIRDLAWMQIVEDFRRELRKKNARLDELEDYAASHPLIYSVGHWKREFWNF